MSAVDSTTEPDRKTGTRTFTVVAALVLVIGLVILAVFGVRYLRERDSVAEIVEARESANVTASEVVQTVFSFHYEDVDASLTRLEEISAGNFLTEQRQFSDEVRKRVEEQKAVVTATISNTAVSELNIDDGTAAVIVVFTATSEREGEEDIVRRQSSVVDLLWEDDRWKAVEVNQVGASVPVGVSSESVRELEGALGGSEGAEGGLTGSDQTDSGEGGDAGSGTGEDTDDGGP